MSNVKTKICSKCKTEKLLSEFYKDKSKDDGLHTICKVCNSKNTSSYYQKYKEKLKLKSKLHYNINKKKIKEAERLRRKSNKKKLSAKHKIYYRNNKEQIARSNKFQLNAAALYCRFYNKLSYAESLSEGRNGVLLVLCAYCGKKYIPTVQAVKSRIRALNGTAKGEQRFYCSESCKKACPIYGQRKYPKGFKKATSREVVPLLRQLVLKRDNYTCQKCGVGTENAQLHVHHILSYKLNKMVANDPDNCITLCKKCHKEVHSRGGCRYSDLKCK